MKRAARTMGIGVVTGVASVMVAWVLEPQVRVTTPTTTRVAAEDEATQQPIVVDAPIKATASSGTRAATPPPEREDLRVVLASDDDAKKIAVIEDLVRDGVVTALPELASIDLKRQPEAAPTIIHAVANLAAQGDRSDRNLAARTLSRWLRDESLRTDERDAAGNVPNIVEALSEVGGSDAALSLMAALDGGKLDLSVETLTVQKLGELGDVRARSSIVRFAERVANEDSGDDAFVRELRDEASTEAKKALARLAG